MPPRLPGGAYNSPDITTWRPARLGRASFRHPNRAEYRLERLAGNAIESFAANIFRGGLNRRVPRAAGSDEPPFEQFPYDTSQRTVGGRFSTRWFGSFK
jgi:hypothetical protein